MGDFPGHSVLSAMAKAMEAFPVHRAFAEQVDTLGATPGALVIAALALTMIGLQVFNSLTGYFATSFALQPRTAAGLRGLLLAPLLHWSWAHLFSNLLPFVVLSGVVLTEGTPRYLEVTGAVIVASGLLVWLFGRSGIHAGASSWVFGLWAYILASAWLRQSFAHLAGALFVLACFGFLVRGLIPKRGVSVEMHISGVLAGIAAAQLPA